MRMYLQGKLTSINRKIAIHEGNANERFMSEAKNIYRLPLSGVPDSYKKDFLILKNRIIKTIKENYVHGFGFIPPKLYGAQNKTTAKFIKLLIDVERTLKED